MANIRGFEAPNNLDLRPTETGIEAVAGAARRTEGFYSQAAEAQGQVGRAAAGALQDVGKVATDQIDHEQITAGGAHGAELFDNLSQSKDAAIKAIDPNDPAYGQKVEVAMKQWREKNLEPALDEFRSGFTTEKSQAFADGWVEKTRDHMFVQSAADISNAAKIGITNSVRTIANVASNTALRDPSSVGAQLDLVEHSIGGLVDSSPVKGIAGASIKSDVLEKTREQIVKAGAVGAIQKSNDPEKTAGDWVAKYPQYINGTEAVQLAANARQQIRANNYDVEQSRRRNKEIATDKSNEATNQYIIDVRSQDPKLANDPTAKKILNDPTLLKTDKNNLLNYIDRQAKPETEARLSSTTFVGLLRDLRAPDSDPDKVMQKAWDARLTDPGKPGSMSEKDFNQFRAEVVARKTPEGAALEHDRNLFFKQYAGAIAGIGYDPVVGSPKLYAVEMESRRVEADLKRKGLDPHLAYDPSSPYFIGKPERLAKFSGSMQDDLSTKATTPKSINLTGDGSQVTGMETKDLPPITRDAPRTVDKTYMTPSGPMTWTGTGWVPLKGQSQRFSEGDFGNSKDPDWSGSKPRFGDFRQSENIDDRRAESGTIKERLREIFFGKEATYGGLTPREYNNKMSRYSSEELVKLYESGGPSKIAKELGFNDIEKKK